MAGIRYGLADFVSGGPILDLPVMKGASWAAQLNRPDSLSCKVDMRDPDALALDLRSSAAAKKTIIVARTEADVMLAWGVLDEPEWDEDKRTLSLQADGVWDGYFGKTIIAPASARTAPLVTTDAEGYPVVNPALNTNLSGLSLGSIGKRLVAQRLAWPGAPTAFVLPDDEPGTRVREYLFSDMKTVSSALTDLTNVENGPDFAFDAQRASDGLGLRYVMRHGSEARPRIGTDAGVWALGNLSKITGLKSKSSGSEMGSAAWLTAGRSSGSALLSRRINDELLAAGYPPLDLVDTSHGDVTRQATLDDYAAELISFGRRPTQNVSFSIRADSTPALGSYRPGDTVTIDVPKDHPYLVGPIPIRITSISGDEKGKTVKIGCVVLNGQ